MKTITIYELLGMVKDGKELPKKIKYKGVIFENKDEDLLNDINCSLFEHRGNECEKLLPMLNDEVEILEEDKEIEKLDLFEDLEDILKSNIDTIIINAIHKCLTCEKNKINEIIDYLKSKGE